MNRWVASHHWTALAARPSHFTHQDSSTHGHQTGVVPGIQIKTFKSYTKSKPRAGWAMFIWQALRPPTPPHPLTVNAQIDCSTSLVGLDVNVFDNFLQNSKHFANDASTDDNRRSDFDFVAYFYLKVFNALNDAALCHRRSYSSRGKTLDEVSEEIWTLRKV